ncbi:fumarylacetoacetate hydrolase family protein [Dehalobacter sp. DCM]|uniref:fumarylacetoacetate hydrolase family protein n=1 Tax=Dehalobacter sp. DCM TaxID=2907827 RepID=UPI00308177AB|nr:fumarylacetoacetate hydrolase family protein [Dehalobacter sp. DCM]
MKYLRFSDNHNVIRYGVVKDSLIFAINGDIFGEFMVTDKSYLIESVRLLAPVIPSKVLCIGLNYIDHAKEFGKPLPEEPLLFIKPPSSVIGPEENIIYPPQTANLHYEAELAIVIGKEAKNVERRQAAEYIFGYTVANDITARDLQHKDGQWTRAKGFDTFCPLGPWIETDIDDPGNLTVKLTLNGLTRQDSNTNNLVFDCFQLVEYLSGIMTLLPGDVILTGTPAGVGPMEAGDVVKAEIENIGALTNYVIK